MDLEERIPEPVFNDIGALAKWRYANRCFLSKEENEDINFQMRLLMRDFREPRARNRHGD